MESIGVAVAMLASMCCARCARALRPDPRHVPRNTQPVSFLLRISEYVLSAVLALSEELSAFLVFIGGVSFPSFVSVSGSPGSRTFPGACGTSGFFALRCCSGWEFLLGCCSLGVSLVLVFLFSSCVPVPGLA